MLSLTRKMVSQIKILDGDATKIAFNPLTLPCPFARPNSINSINLFTLTLHVLSYNSQLN